MVNWVRAHNAYLVADLLVLTAVMMLVAARGPAPLTDQSHSLLALASVAAAVAAALLGLFAAILRRDVQASSISAGLAFYSLIILPSTVHRAGSEVETASWQAVRLVGYFVIIVLLGMAVRPPARMRLSECWVVAGSGALLALAIGEFVRLFPGLLGSLVSPPGRGIGLIAIWCGLSAVYVVVGWRRGRSGLWRIGLGLGLLAAAQLVWLVENASGGPATTLSGELRLLGLFVVALGSAQLARRALVLIADERDAQQEELRAAALHLQKADEQTVERDHEIRNGLSGLAAAAQQLGASEGGANDQLRAAVCHELDRLCSTLLPSPPGTGGLTRVDAIGPLLTRLVNLRRCAGMTISLEADPDVWTEVAPPVLAQIVTNLLDNCSRHAAGSPVPVRAQRSAGRVVVEVADEGPGVPPGEETAVLGREVSTSEAGLGLGLFISHRLATSVGGDLTVMPRPGRGCRVVVRLQTRETGLDGPTFAECG